MRLTIRCAFSDGDRLHATIGSARDHLPSCSRFPRRSTEDDLTRGQDW